MATATKKSKHITPELKALIVESVHAVLRDPDFGLELTDEMKRHLNQIKHKRQKYYSHDEVKRRLFGHA
ncbi:MAG: hypothetical protein Q7R54_00465 [bacterium]|nr:hypothetical protein [bacterium]